MLKARTIVIVIILLALSWLAGRYLWPHALSGGQATGLKSAWAWVMGTNKPASKQMYTCTMHPFIISPNPGKCPICNMDLVPVEQVKKSAAVVQGDHAEVALEPYRRQLIGVRTEAVTRMPLARQVRAVGIVDYNERTLSVITMKTGGYVEELNVKAVGDPVTKGQVLFSYYSPDVLEAQRNYLVARKNAAAEPDAASPTGSLAKAALESIRERLLLWDVKPDFIKQIEESGQALRDVPVKSDADGIVVARNILLGTAFDPGQQLFKIADLSTVWVYADVYENEIPFIKPGQEAKITTASLPGETLIGKVDFIYPYMNEMSRTVRVRLVIPNAEGKLKPGMYTTAALDSPLGDCLAINDNAVLYTGTRNLVFVEKEEGVYLPRDVVIGHHAEGMVEVLSGLAEGEKIVTNGNFLIDSESRIVADRMHGMTATEETGKKKEGQPPANTENNMPGMPGM